jgi:hypothetical protein
MQALLICCRLGVGFAYVHRAEMTYNEPEYCLEAPS